jgi:hypothetical protein
MSIENDNGAIEILNMALAIALLAEGEGSSDKVAALYSCSRNVVKQLLLSPRIMLKGQLLLIVVSVYYFSAMTLEWRRGSPHRPPD